MLLSADNASVSSFLDGLFSAQIGSDKLTLTSALLMCGVSLVLGFLIAILYIYTQKRVSGSIRLAITLIMVPAIVTLIVMLIGSNLARAFTLAGAFSLIRYRSDPASPKDIAYIFFALAIGIACGIGYVAYAAVFTVLFGLIMFIISITGFGEPKINEMQLKILIPENLNFDGAFDDILTEGTESWKLRKVRTSDFGTMIELIYRIRMKKGVDKKDLLDKIRCRNGNLDVSLTLEADEDK